MLLYREHIALIRSLYDGTDVFTRSLRRFEERCGGSIDEAAFLDFVGGQHLVPWLKPFLLDFEAEAVFSPSLLETMRGGQKGSAAQARRVVAQAGEIRRAFSGRGIESLFFKGVVSGAEIYGDPARRQQRDVDVMVDRSDLRNAVTALGELGYNTDSDSSTGEPLASRVDRMLTKPYATNDTACSLERGRRKVDLHCALRNRYEASVDFRYLIEGSREIEVDGEVFRAPSREKTVLIQLILIADDLRRGACKAKLFLDLYVFSRALGPSWSWESFFEARRAQRLEKLAVNICALLLDLWACSDELPELAAAVDRRARLLEIMNSAEADAIISRPRGDPQNKRLMKRIYRGGTAIEVARRLAKDYRHAAVHLAGLRRSEYRFTPLS